MELTVKALALGEGLSFSNNYVNIPTILSHDDLPLLYKRAKRKKKGNSQLIVVAKKA